MKFFRTVEAFETASTGSTVRDCLGLMCKLGLINEAARGGDIDLIVFAPDLAAEDRLRLSLRVAVAFRSICDEKIDVHVLDPHDLTVTERAFLGVIRSEPLHLGRLVGA